MTTDAQISGNEPNGMLIELLTEAGSLASSLGQNMINVADGLDNRDRTPGWARSQCAAAAHNAREIADLYERVSRLIST